MLKLMIVDDSNIMRNKIARCESSRMFEVVFKAKNGQEAISACAQLRTDVVTMDLTMPRMDGLECIEKLIKINPEIRILVVSALSDKATGIRALSLGASGFLCKPFTDDELFEALRELVED